MSAKGRGARRVAIWAGKFFLANVFALVVLSIVGSWYYYGGQNFEAPIANETLDRPEPNSYVSRCVEGRGFARLDANGYNNAFYRERGWDLADVDALLQGSSYLESFQTSENETFVYRLNEAFENGPETLKFYSCGRSSHTFVTSTARYEDALKLFKPKKYAMIECFAVPSVADVEKSLNNDLKNFSGLPTKTKRILKWFRFLPWLHLKYFEGCVKPRLTAQKPAPQDATPEEKKASWTKLARKIRATSDKYGVTPIIFFHIAFGLNQDGTVFPRYDVEELAAFRAVCESEGIVFVDATQRMRREYEENNVWGYGFGNAELVSGHFNPDGHRILAEVLAETIRELDAKEKAKQ